MAGWARGRSLTPASAAGVSLALGLCAAAWFTAGTRAGDINGALALCGCYLAGRAAGQGAAGQGAVGQAAVGQGAAGQSVAGQGEAWRWPARVLSAAAECAVYAGLAVGADSAGWGSTWELAVIMTVLLGVRQTMTARHHLRQRDAGERDTGERVAGELGAGERDTGERVAGERRADRAGVIERATEAILTMPAGGRVLLIAVAAPAWGPRAALMGLVVWGIAATGCSVAGQGGDGIAAGEPARHGRAALVASRDDGGLARFLGRCVRGQLVPLPPALAGLAAVSILAVLGLRNLPGIIVLTPPVVMLLAAPGSSHAHDGRFDWLVPVLLQIGQYVYISALGFASGVAGPVIFALCATIAIRAADLAYRAENVLPVAAGLGTGMGWEGRMLAAGLGTVLGIGTFAYLALAAYLGLLICRQVSTGSVRRN